jgi:portal protein
MADNLAQQSANAPQVGGVSEPTPEQQAAAQADADAAEKAQEDADEAILERARTFRINAEDGSADERKLFIEDSEFSTGKQWPDNIQQERERDGRPCLVVNRLPQLIQQVTNDQRQNRPCIKVHPVGDGADIDTGKIIQGLVRHIEYNSNADVAYDRAADSTARGGFGYWRVTTEFSRPDSFDQEIFIKSIRNTLSVLFDPKSTEPDGSDANEAMVTEFLDHDEFKRQYPNAVASSSEGWTSVGNNAPRWIRDGAITVAEYFYRDWVPVKIYRLSTGETVREDGLQQRLNEAAAAGVPAQVVQSRQSKEPRVRWVKLNGIEVLERGEWAGKYIPIVPVYGAEIYINGKRILEGMVRHAKDPQRMLNYWKSAQTEAIALAPRAPFIGAEGQFEGHEESWQNANKKNQAFLQYKPTSLAGSPLPPPERSAVEPAVQAISMAAQGASKDIEDVTGINDPSRGFGAADQSGIAIQKRNVQAQTANFHLYDNLTRSIRHTGRICVDLIPHIYDTIRTARIIGDDGSQKIVTLNASHKDENGEEVLYDLDAGLYDVTMDTGPSFASKRQEAATSMQDLARSYPKILDIAGDLFVKNMDWPGAQDLADRIRKTLPPGLADDSGPMSKVPAQVKAQIQQMVQQNQMLSKHLQQATQEIAMKRYELEHRERIELAKINADIEMTLAKIGSQGAVEALKQEVGVLRHQMQLSGMGQSMDQDPNSQDPGAQPAASPQPTGGQPPGQPMGNQ